MFQLNSKKLEKKTNHYDSMKTIDNFNGKTPSEELNLLQKIQPIMLIAIFLLKFNKGKFIAQRKLILFLVS